jgi:ferredoxin-NADP reductase
MENIFTYTVENISRETPNVCTLQLVSDKDLPPIRAGQYITVFFPETGHMEGKSYSISNIKGDNSFSITVKGIGEFSNKLISLKPGDKVSASFPYGYFYSESVTNPFVLVAGGIGVAPLHAMITESLKLNPTRKLLLFYSDKTPTDQIFKKEFDELMFKFPGTLDIKYYITQAEADANSKKGRIKAEDIILESKNLEGAEYFICGSIPFVRDFWKDLRAVGVSEDVLYTEAFF